MSKQDKDLYRGAQHQLNVDLVAGRITAQQHTVGTINLRAHFVGDVEPVLQYPR